MLTHVLLEQHAHGQNPTVSCVVVRTEPRTLFARSDSQDAACARAVLLASGMVDTNPWRASCTLPVEQQPTTGLLGILSKSKALGIRQEPARDTRETQQYATAALQYIRTAEHTEKQEVTTQPHCAV